MSEHIAAAAADGFRWGDVTQPFLRVEGGGVVSHVGVIEHRIELGTNLTGVFLRTGARVRRLGDARDTEVTSRRARHAPLEGVDLHANVWGSARDRAGLQRLARYILRPPFAQERLRWRSDGRIGLELKTAWHDGTREVVFEPQELLERLAAMTPRPATNLLIAHGLLAARARWRQRVVAYGRGAPEPTAVAPARIAGSKGTSEGTKATSGSRTWNWAL